MGSIEELTNADPRNPFVCVVALIPDEIVSFDSPWWSVGSRPHWARRNRSDTQVIGDTWLREKQDRVLAVPSVIIPEENNFLLHPSLIESGAVVVDSVSPFVFDPRLLRRM